MGRVRGLKVVLGLAVASATMATAPAAMAVSISGTVTDAVSHAPIAGVQVCADPAPFASEPRCSETDGAGAYTIDSLAGNSYSVQFSGSLHDLNYVRQYYDGKDSGPGDVVTVGATEARTGINAEMHEGGLIVGTATDAVSLGPVAGMLVCSFAREGPPVAGGCDHTAANGTYSIVGLPTDEYEVEFLSEDEVNYLDQYWPEGDGWADAELVSVTAGATTSGIDVALKPGVEISGTVREAGTGQSLAGIGVTLLHAGNEQREGWPAVTDSSGHYVFRGRPAGTYVVAFSRPLQWFETDDWFSTRFYKDATSFAAATRLVVAPPEILTGIDGEVVYEGPSRERVQVILTPAQPPITSPGQPRRCRKGFRKRRVKGKVRCVKVQKRKGKGQRKGAKRRGGAARR